MKVVRGFLRVVSYLCAAVGALAALVVFSPKARDKILAWSEKLLDKMDRPAKPKLADEDDEINIRADDYIRGLNEEDRVLEREYYSLTEDDFYDDDLD